MSIKHLAVIMDGNGRWAESQGLAKIEGHKKGGEAAKRLIQFTIKHKISYLTLFAFSSENWGRPQKEVNSLLRLMGLYLRKEVTNLNNHGIKLTVIGDKTKLSPGLQRSIENIEKLTSNNSTLNLYIAFSYGGRLEIIEAYKKIMCSGVKAEELTENEFRKYFYSPTMPDVDLLIRTSGERRISNFLLWHLAYSELYFTNKYWPDFDEEDFELALKDFYSRQRTFGLLRQC